MKLVPGPEDGGPSSIFHDEGASTDVTGTVVSSRALMTAGKGSRTSPEKEKPLGDVKKGEWNQGDRKGTGNGDWKDRRTEDGVNDVVCFF